MSKRVWLGMIMMCIAAVSNAYAQWCDPPCRGPVVRHYTEFEMTFSPGDYTLVDTEAIGWAIADSWHPCPSDGNGYYPMDGNVFDNDEVCAHAFSHFDAHGGGGKIFSYGDACIVGGGGIRGRLYWDRGVGGSGMLFWLMHNADRFVGGIRSGMGDPRRIWPVLSYRYSDFRVW